MPTVDKYISKIELGNQIYTIKDATAREAIDTLTKAVVYKGVVDTTKPDNTLVDGSTKTSVILKDNTTLIVSNIEGIGSMVVQDQLEFIWNGTKWNELGSTSSLGQFAYADEGQVTVPTITKGTKNSVSVSGQVSVSGTVSGQDAKVTGTANIAGINATGSNAAENSFRYIPRTSIKTAGNAILKTGESQGTKVITAVKSTSGSLTGSYTESEEKLTFNFTAPTVTPTETQLTIDYTAPTLENLGTDFAVTLNNDVKAAVVEKSINSSGDNTLSSTATYLQDVSISSTTATVTPKISK